VNLRHRLTLTLAGVALIPLLILGAGVRREMTRRLGARDEVRVAALAGAMRADLDRRMAETRDRLAALRADLAQDPELRLVLLEAPGSGRGRLLGWAGDAARRAGLAMLQLQDSAGRILSSAHFRQDFDRLDREAPDLLRRATGGMVILRVRTAGGTLPVLATIDSVPIGGQWFSLVGGLRADSLGGVVGATGDDLRTLLVLDGRSPPGVVVDEVVLPQSAPPGAEGSPVARFVVVRDPGPIRALQRSVDRWVAGMVAATLGAALLLAALLARRISRPIEELAHHATRVDLDRPAVDFALERDDELGVLAHRLQEMTGRLLAGAARLREAERRAVTGDLARQVTHDIRNGLVPIRNVLQHLDEEAAARPGELATVYRERQETLTASVAYLEDLARTYAQLSPPADQGRSDANTVLREAAAALRAPGIGVQLDLDEALPPVRAAEVVLRRIVDNLVSNAVEAIGNTPGTLTLRSAGLDSGDRRARLTVSDTGRGMGRTELQRAFEDFHTTRPDGTGLGLSVVRRLVADLGGTLRVESRPGLGTTFVVEIPVA